MIAKRSDLGRIQEIHDVIVQAQAQMSELGITKERFLNPLSAQDDLIAEGITNRILRITEEAGHIDDEVAARYGFDRRGAVGVRNRLAHVYGEVDRDILWQVIEEDFDALLASCQSFCDDNGLELE